MRISEICLDKSSCVNCCYWGLAKILIKIPHMAYGLTKYQTLKDNSVWFSLELDCYLLTSRLILVAPWLQRRWIVLLSCWRPTHIRKGLKKREWSSGCLLLTLSDICGVKFLYLLPTAGDCQVIYLVKSEVDVRR